MDVVLAIGALLVGAAAVFAAYRGWHAVATDDRLRGNPRSELRVLAGSRAGRVALVLMLLAVVAGVAGGVWLSDRAADGRDDHVERGR